MSSSSPATCRCCPPRLISSAPASTRPWFSKQSQARRALSLRRTSISSHRKSTKAPASSVSSRAGVAVLAGADDMNRTRIEPQLFAHGAEIDERRRPGRARPRRRAASARVPLVVVRTTVRALADLGGVLARRVAEVEAGQRQAAALAAEQHPAGRHASRPGGAPRRPRRRAARRCSRRPGRGRSSSSPAARR